ICARRAVLLKRRDDAAGLLEPNEQSAGGPGASKFLVWVALSACASVFLLATTNMICQEVAVVPFLWVLPLSLYLLSFILCFENERWYRRDVFHALFVLVVCFSGAFPIPRSGAAHLAGALISYSALLFTGCMVCHGEVARLKPAARYLTSFYLSIA